MKTCPKCGHTQENGNFCGKCGTGLNESVESQQTSTPSSSNTTETLEKFKHESRQYSSFFVDQIKQPTKNFFNTDTYFKQNITSMVIYLALFALVIYTFLTKMGYESDLWFVQLPSKSSIIFKMDLFALLMIALGMLSVFITNKLFGPEVSMKTIVCQCASYFTAPIVLLIIAILAVLIESLKIGFILLVISLFLVMLVIPMFVTLMLLNKHSKTIDRFYAYLISIAIIVILNYVIYKVLLGSVISNIFGSGY